MKHSPTPDCDKIMNDYPTDESSEGEGDEAKKDEPEAAANEKQEKKESHETNTFINKGEDSQCAICDPITRKVFYIKFILLNIYLFLLYFS